MQFQSNVQHILIGFSWKHKNISGKETNVSGNRAVGGDIWKIVGKGIE